jgi:formylglycine-generating enzyme required for sulfatase activity
MFSTNCGNLYHDEIERLSEEKTDEGVDLKKDSDDNSSNYTVENEDNANPSNNNETELVDDSLEMPLNFLKIDDKIYSNKIILSWSSLPEASLYHLYRSEEEYGTYNKIASTAELGYQDYEIINEKVYYYKVRFMNTYDLLSPFSNSVSSYAFLLPPVVTSTSNPLLNKISLSWEENKEIDKYFIYRSLLSESNYNLIADTSQNFWEDTDLSQGVFYYYKVKSYLESSNLYSSFSSPVKNINIISYENEHGIEFSKILAGSFLMGETGLADEVHQVALSTSFYISKTEITSQQWNSVKSWTTNRVGINKYEFTDKEKKGSADSGEDNQPITNISWYDALKWCNALSEKEADQGQEVAPCYYTSSGQAEIYRQGDIDVSSDSVKWKVAGYRLPTEAEWEYVCRFGENFSFFWGDQARDEQAGLYAWYLENSNYQTYSVALKQANGFGVYDVLGNVREWCYDWFDGDYPSLIQTDPKGSASGSKRTIRGGSYLSDLADLHSASRDSAEPDEYFTDLGFRVVLIITESTE